MKVCIVGLGLIGGSMAIDIKKNYDKTTTTIIGVDANAQHQQQALQLQLVDEVQPLDKALLNANLVILAIPVNAIIKLLPRVLNTINTKCAVTDVGSTKNAIIQSVVNHPKRGNYVAAHPMAGTEFSGPQAAIPNLFQQKINIICNSEQSNEPALNLVIEMFTKLGMFNKFMPALQHDLHAAYVSHISHISSFMLAETVLDKEGDEQAIFDMAAGGFESTVRLAKSSPEMWAPIFLQNAEFLTEVIDTYIENMRNFRAKIFNKDIDGLVETMKKANNIKRILK